MPSQYLRDQKLTNLTFDCEALKTLNKEIEQIAEKQNSLLNAAQLQPQERISRILLRTYIIRFDGKGFRYYEFSEVMHAYENATTVEWVNIIIDSAVSRNTNSGKKFQLQLNALDPNGSWLTVEDDDKDWMDVTFSNVHEILMRNANRYWFVRNEVTPLLIQIAGAMTIFYLSMLGGKILAPRLQIDFLFSFFATFLFLSNLWTFISNWFLRAFNFFWPNIRFTRKKEEPWFLRAMFSTVVGAGLLWVVTHLIGYLHMWRVLFIK